MKTKLLILGCICSAFLLTSCSNVGGCCGYSYYDYSSQCGLPSCTANAYYMGTYSAPCGTYCYNYY